MTRLYDYWRSSASYRLRITLNLLDIDHDTTPVDLKMNEHRSDENLDRNPQGLVPTLEIDDQTLTQSLAIIEYLDETRGAGLLPSDALGRARVRALSYAIAMEIHPICNLGVATYATENSGGNTTMESWNRHFISKGFTGFERMLHNEETGRYCHGDQVSMADICVVPQVYNARRWGIDLEAFPKLSAIQNRLEKLEPVQAAHPDRHC